MDDQTYRTLLEQHFGSSRFAVKPKLKHIYGAEGGYDCEIDGFDLALDRLLDAEMKLMDAAEFLCKPAAHAFVAKQIAYLRVVMAKSLQSNEDLMILIDAYTEHLSEYPPDIVKFVCDEIIKNQKWFPLVSEMRRRAEVAMKFRRAVLSCFEECRNPLLAKEREQKRIAVDPRLGVHWKSLGKKDWLPQHYEWALEEVRSFLALAKQNPQSMDIKFWDAEVDKREAELAAANGGSASQTHAPATTTPPIEQNAQAAS